MVSHWRSRLPLGFYLEEFLLAMLVLVDVLGFFSLLPPDVEFFDRILTWSLMAFLFYSAKPSEIFFGQRKRLFDILFIYAMFLFVLKDIFLAIAEINAQQPYYTLFYSWILSKSAQIGLASFVEGGILLLALAAYATLRISCGKDSLLSFAKENGIIEKGVMAFLRRFSKVLVIMCAFFVIIFNLVIEWIALIEDDIITIFLIILFIGVYLKYRRLHREGLDSIHAQQFLFAVAESANKFYARFMTLLRKREGVMVVISGMLILHLLTDLVVFAVPLIIGSQVPDFATVLLSHEGLPSLIASATHPLQTLFYMQNIVGSLMLMLAPAYIWHLLHVHKKAHIHPVLCGAFLSCVVTFFFAPAFVFTSINSPLFIGVDMGTSVVQSSWGVLLVSVLALVLPLVKSLQRISLYATVCGMLYFVIMYFWLYLQSIVNYFWSVFVGLPVVVALFMNLFLLITVLFYLGGVIHFAWVAAKEFDLV